MTLFTTVDPRPIHFMGIAGAGMSGLALLAKEQAVAITGCDNDPTGAADLAANGVEIWRGDDPRGAGEDTAALHSPPEIVFRLFLFKKKKKKQQTQPTRVDRP